MRVAMNRGETLLNTPLVKVLLLPEGVDQIKEGIAIDFGACVTHHQGPPIGLSRNWAQRPQAM